MNDNGTGDGALVVNGHGDGNGAATQTMVAAEATVQTAEEDRRTPIGRFLRRYSLDELPSSSTSCAATCR